MKRNVWLFLAFLFFANSLTAGTMLTPEGRLRKLSRQIRGIDPTFDEYKNLESSVRNREEEKFFQAETEFYLTTPQHTGRMVHRLDELFRVTPTKVPPEVAFEYQLDKMDQNARSNLSSDYQATHNSLDTIFRELAEKNQSWDSLISRTNYTVYYPIKQYEDSIADVRFFKGIFSDLERDAGGDPLYFESARPDKGSLQVHSAPNDPRLAGALTTSRFLNRYTNTDINENRRRAAAVFRIFLCEPLQPVILENLDDIKPYLRQALDETQNIQIHPPVSAADRHGNDPKCISCHERLDPLGKTFGLSGIGLMTKPVAGRLFFRRKDGSVVNISGRGIGDLARALVQLPEYKTCQVKHFWEWFMGTDVPMDGKLQDLVSHFDSVGHRTNDFIAYLVNRPEFYTRPQAGKVTFSLVQPILNKCTSCHSGMRIVPDFTHLPINGSDMENQTWIGKIYNIMDLNNNGMHRRMPIKESAWQPTQEEIDALKAWITSGAQDESGKPTLTESYFTKLVKGTL